MNNKYRLLLGNTLFSAIYCSAFVILAIYAHVFFIGGRGIIFWLFLRSFLRN